MKSRYLPIIYSVDKMILVENDCVRLGMGISNNSKYKIDYGIINCTHSNGVYISVKLGLFHVLWCVWR